MKTKHIWVIWSILLCIGVSICFAEQNNTKRPPDPTEEEGEDIQSPENGKDPEEQEKESRRKTLEALGIYSDESMGQTSQPEHDSTPPPPNPYDKNAEDALKYKWGKQDTEEPSVESTTQKTEQRAVIEPSAPEVKPQPESFEVPVDSKISADLQKTDLSTLPKVSVPEPDAQAQEPSVSVSPNSDKSTPELKPEDIKPFSLKDLPEKIADGIKSWWNGSDSTSSSTNTSLPQSTEQSQSMPSVPINRNSLLTTDQVNGVTDLVRSGSLKFNPDEP